MSEHGDSSSDSRNTPPEDEQSERSVALYVGLARQKETRSLLLNVIPAMLRAMSGDFGDLTPLQRQIAYAVAERFHPLGDGVVDWISQNQKVEHTARIILTAFLTERSLNEERANPGEFPLPR